MFPFARDLCNRAVAGLRHYATRLSGLIGERWVLNLASFVSTACEAGSLYMTYDLLSSVCFENPNLVAECGFEVMFGEWRKLLTLGIIGFGTSACKNELPSRFNTNDDKRSIRQDAERLA